MIKLNRSNRHWNRSQRRRYHDNDFDIQFDWNRRKFLPSIFFVKNKTKIHQVYFFVCIALNQSCYVILYHIISKDSIQNKNKLLAYLNLFTKYCLYRYGKLDISEQAKLANINGQSSSETTSSFLCDTEILCW